MADSKTSDYEVDFQLEELFFSRTNPNGIIQSGNQVFQRVSGYTWDEMRNAPHKIVRHPDMPETIFWLFWDRLKRGQPVGAYVKNRSKDGGQYWVYAMAAPVDGGYLSIRTKPSSQFFEPIKDIYAEIRALELDGSIDHKKGMAMLTSHMADMKIRDYNHFMALSAIAETSARNDQLGRKQPKDIGALSSLIEASSEMLGHSAEVKNDFNQIRGFPVNLRIQSGKFSSVAKLFGVISDDYNRFCKGIEKHLSEFIETSVQVADVLSDATFRVCTSEFQKEMANLFQTEADQDDASGVEEEIQLLREQAKQFHATTTGALKKSEDTARAFERSGDDVNWLVGGLDVVRVLGMAETSRMNGDGGTLHQMMEEADRFQGQIKKHLAQLTSLNNTVLQHTQTMVRAA